MTIMRRCSCGKRFKVTVPGHKWGPTKCEVCRHYGSRFKKKQPQDRPNAIADGSSLVRAEDGSLTPAKTLAIRMLKG